MTESHQLGILIFIIKLYAKFQPDRMVRNIKNLAQIKMTNQDITNTKNGPFFVNFSPRELKLAHFFSGSPEKKLKIERPTFTFKPRYASFIYEFMKVNIT